MAFPKHWLEPAGPPFSFRNVGFCIIAEVEEEVKKEAKILWSLLEESQILS